MIYQRGLYHQAVRVRRRGPRAHLRFFVAAIIGRLSGGGQRQRVGTLAATLVLLAGCAPLPAASSFASPLAMQADPPTYIPTITRGWQKLGMAGCAGWCGQLGCSWCYAWSTQPALEAGIESVPMLRDASSMAVTELGGNSTWLLGFNEPDLCPEQACLTPLAAAVLWRAVEERWPDRLLVAPAPSHLDATWLVDFRNAYQNLYSAWPRLDALALHCYFRTASECIALAGQYEAWAAEWGVSEGWLTEFTFTSTTVDWQAQISILVAYLEEVPFWTRYAPYVSNEACKPGSLFWNCIKSGDPSLFTAAGVLTDVGREYLRPTQ